MTSSLERIALPQEQRSQRFFAAFVKKFRAVESKEVPEGEEKIEIMHHKFNLKDAAITKEEYKEIPSCSKFNVGTGVIYFRTSFNRIMISTSGIFFKALSPSDDGYISWMNLDFMAPVDIATDDTTIRLQRDEDLLKQSIKGLCYNIITGIFLLILAGIVIFLFSVIYSLLGSVFYTVIAMIALVGFLAGATFITYLIIGMLIAGIHALLSELLALIVFPFVLHSFRGNAAYHNVIAIGSQRSPQRINIGPTTKAQSMV